MHNIETVSSNKIKEISKLHQKKYRDELGLYICEGSKIIEELYNTKAEVKEVFVLNGNKTFDFKCPIYTVDESIMKKISTTDTPCEVLAIVKKKEQVINNFIKLKKIILLDSISDPGNLGTIIRSAAAFNIEGIILFGNCVDLYSTKVIRSAAGNYFKTPIISIKDINELKEKFNNHTLITTALSKENNISINECKKFEKYIIMFGNEAKGLSSDLIKLSKKNIKIDMAKDVESLNLSVTASIIMYELSNII